MRGKKEVVKKTQKVKDVPAWVKKEVKRIEKLKARATSGKRKRKRASAKYIKGVLSAVQHVSKTGKDKFMEDKGFDDSIRTSGSAPIASGNYSEVRFQKENGVMNAKKKGRAKSVGGVSKPKVEVKEDPNLWVVYKK